MTRQQIVVMGGGISGLSFAHQCARSGLEVLVLEQAPTPGGCIQTLRQPDGFWCELGAHTCYNSYGGLLEILEQVGVLTSLLPRRKVPFKLLVDGQVRTIPSQLHLLELLGSAWRLLSMRKDGLSVRDYYSRIVGIKNYREVFGPLFAAVPSQSADDFPADMLFKRRDRRKDILRSFTMEGGLQSAVEAIARSPRIQVQCGARVMGMRRVEGGFVLRLQDGSEIETHRLALAAPPTAAAEVLREVVPDLASLLGQIRVTPVESIGVVVRKEATKLPPVAGIIPLNGPFYSVVARDTVEDPGHRGFAFHFKPETAPDDRMQAIRSLLDVKADAIEATAHRQVVLPSPVIGHHRVVEEIDRVLEKTPGIFVTGNYFGGLAIEDCVQRSRQEAARLLAGAG